MCAANLCLLVRWVRVAPQKLSIDRVCTSHVPQKFPTNRVNGSGTHLNRILCQELCFPVEVNGDAGRMRRIAAVFFLAKELCFPVEVNRDAGKMRRIAAVFFLAHKDWHYVTA